MYSKDTLNWSKANSNTRELLFGCTWGNNTFVAVSSGGSIIHSKDGIQWDFSFKNKEILFEDVEYGENGFVAVGAKYPLKVQDDTRYIYYSKDGITWEQVFQSIGNYNWRKVSYLNNTYVAHGAYTNEIAYSKDGINWTIIEVTAPIFNSGIIWDGYKYVSVGTELILNKADGDYTFTEVPKVYTSTNLIDWVKIDHNIKEGVFLQEVVLYNGYYYMTCSVDEGNIVLRSLDLKNWKEDSNLYNELTSSLVNNNMLTFVGWDGTLVNITKSDIKHTESYNSDLTQVIYNGKTFLVTGHDGRFYRSEDGETWIQYSSGIDFIVSDIVWTGDKYVALRQIYDYNNKIYTGVELYSSLDGLKWALESKVDNKSSMSLRYCNAKYFLLGQKGEIYWSTDAKSWVKSDTTNQNWLNDIEWFNNQYFAVGMFGTLLKSSDGIKWESSKLGNGNDLNDIETNGKSMLIVGDFSGTYLTTNGIDWTLPQGYSTVNYDKTLWDGIQYVIFSYKGVYYKTKDGKNFTKYTTDMFSDVSAVEWNGEKYVVVGRDGAIATQVPNDFIKVIIDGKPVVFDVAPERINNRTMVPARAVFERVGASVTWDKSTNSVVVVKDDITIVLKVGKSSATVNGVEKPLDSPAVIIGGRTLAPARFIAEELGFKVNYLKDTMTVIMDK